MTSPAALVNKVWNYAHVLRDDGVSHGDYVEQITCLLFLKMDQERHDHLGEVSRIPAKWRWAALKDKEGDELELQYRHTLEALAQVCTSLGFESPPNRGQSRKDVARQQVAQRANCAHGVASCTLGGSAEIADGARNIGGNSGN